MLYMSHISVIYVTYKYMLCISIVHVLHISIYVTYVMYSISICYLFWSLIQKPQYSATGFIFSVLHTYLSHFHPSFPARFWKIHELVLHGSTRKPAPPSPCCLQDRF